MKNLILVAILFIQFSCENNRAKFINQTGPIGASENIPALINNDLSDTDSLSIFVQRQFELFKNIGIEIYSENRAYIFSLIRYHVKTGKIQGVKKSFVVKKDSIGGIFNFSQLTQNEDYLYYLIIDLSTIDYINSKSAFFNKIILSNNKKKLLIPFYTYHRNEKSGYPDTGGGSGGIPIKDTLLIGDMDWRLTDNDWEDLKSN